MLRTAAKNVMGLQRARTLALWLLALLVAVSIGLLLAAKPAHADTIITVNSMEDAGDNNPGNGTCATAPFQAGTEPNCTLRAAIQEANVNGVSDTIVFDSFLSGTITLTLGHLEIANDTPATDDLSIQGPGARKITISGNDANGVFVIKQLTEVTISGLTISGGHSSNINGGGGILNRGTLELTNSTVSGNSSVGNGGGISSGLGALRLTNTTVSGNTANDWGGGIYNVAGMVTLVNSTVGGNTVTGTFAPRGGGIFNDEAGILELDNSTVSGNTANESGGGIVNGDGTLRLTNTIIARNTAPTDPDAQGAFTSQGNNLIGNTTGATGFVTSDLKNVNPLLGPLQNNGGPTNTRALLPGSLAVDAANETLCPPRDQRGVLRKDGDKNGTVVCDIGSFERNDLTPPKVTTISPSAAKRGVERNTNLIATFSEKMDRTTLTNSTFKLFKVNADNTTTQITAVAVSSSTDGLKATLNPFGATSSKVLAANTKYKAIVTTGAKDRAGNRLDQNRTQPNNQQKVWTFTTGSS